MGWRKGKLNFFLVEWESKKKQYFPGREIFAQKDRQELQVESREERCPSEQTGRHLV